MSIRKRQWKTSTGVTTVWFVDYTDQYGNRRGKQFNLKTEADDYYAKVRVAVRAGIEKKYHPVTKHIINAFYGGGWDKVDRCIRRMMPFKRRRYHSFEKTQQNQHNTPS